MSERPPCPLPSDDVPLQKSARPEILTLEGAMAEARRCLSLDVCRGCEVCTLICPDQAITWDEYAGCPTVDPSFCKGCGLCAHFCPRGAISLVP
jgi:Pyruvate/2-oxoacid:ferredoxin oxidoreductase delta subunit